MKLKKHIKAMYINIFISLLITLLSSKTYLRSTSLEHWCSLAGGTREKQQYRYPGELGAAYPLLCFMKIAGPEEFQEIIFVTRSSPNLKIGGEYI